MKKVLLFPLLWMLLINSAYAEVDLNSAEKPAGAMQAAVSQTIPATRNWYAGGAFGISSLSGPDIKNASDVYYRSQGYISYIDDDPDRGCIGNFIRDLFKEIYEGISLEGKIYGGYKLLSHMDVEIGYTRNDNWTPTEDYKKTSTNEVIKSKREISAQALYASVLFRSAPYGRGHSLYFRLGGHYSELKTSKTISGTAANLNAIAAGDNLPYDGVFHGYGLLFGVGFDFRTGKYGAVRLEWNAFNKLGGTPFDKRSINIGYHGFF